MREAQQYPTALTIAGSDSGGGAGMQADIKTMQHFSVFSTNVVVGLTAQNTLGVQGAYPTDPVAIAAQFESVMTDFDIRAAKTGALFDGVRVSEVARNVEHFHIKQLVIDPVMVAKGGAPLLDKEGVAAMKRELLPKALLVTPNIPEAELLAGLTIQTEADMAEAAHRIQELGVPNVLVKGGHLEGDEVLNYALLGDDHFVLKGKKVHTARKHGTGDTLSAAITAMLARGISLKRSILIGNDYMNHIVAQPLFIGHGHGPLNQALWPNPNQRFNNTSELDFSCQLVVGLENVGGDRAKLFSLVKEACLAGVTVVQYREKGTVRPSFLEELAVAKVLKEICQETKTLLFIDDNVNLAIAADADGVHVGQDDASVQSIVKKAPELLIGLSISTMAELEASQAAMPDLAYIGVGPVFKTTTKKDAKPTIGLEGLREIKEAATVPVVAIGGINEERAQAVYQHGADGLAVISAITKSTNIAKTVQRLCKD
ncbi:bifunctional hydroxymethylpyrimidine kinase/phosphomethylpyrimidine kinase [Fructobacillus fructosus]|uniref:bifunctional hydroxymethylpyrimidine kinase/phosphomethylpyrimidine kinase n=1 Tax=Fructobacillus fructosus TaxID=1631 RepID=UPI002DA218F6|nr:Thiamine monophosphate synthase (ThiE) [Fructobacillus fructosus]CAK1230347.1 Thiamine monophosphate synthase (ThiE) [Fructobacillus fructosus]CAK1234392.1 Thiamine monophosphate synthase (ThiE) [Fructobacillus fructosus]